MLSSYTVTPVFFVNSYFCTVIIDHHHVSHWFFSTLQELFFPDSGPFCSWNPQEPTTLKGAWGAMGWHFGIFVGQKDGNRWCTKTLQKEGIPNLIWAFWRHKEGTCELLGAAMTSVYAKAFPTLGSTQNSTAGPRMDGSCQRTEIWTQHAPADSQKPCLERFEYIVYLVHPKTCM